MTAPIATFVHDFEGQPLLTLVWEGQPAWIAREIGQRLGYADRGKRLVTHLRAEWSGEAVEDRDYVMLSGDDLAALKGAGVPAASVVPQRTSGLMLLLEPGLALVLRKTRKPAALRLGRFLEERVLPEIAGDDAEPPRPSVRGALVLVARRPARPPLSVLREARLARQAAVRALWVDLCDRRLRSNALLRLADSLGERLDDDARTALEFTAAEIASGRDLSVLRAAVGLGGVTHEAGTQVLRAAALRLALILERMGARVPRTAGVSPRADA